MIKSWDFIFNEMLNGVVSMVLTLLAILVPLFIVIEVLVYFNLIEKLAKKMTWFAKLIKTEEKAIFPLLVGLVMGVTYGAGTLIELNKKEPLSQRDFTIIGIFMYMCHGLIETVVIFAVIGANIWVISIGRLLIALVITMVLARMKFVRDLSDEPVSINL